MPPIDASIPLQVRPVQLDNPLTQYANVMAIQNAMTQNRMSNMQIEELQRSRAQQENIRNTLAQFPNDRKAAINALMGIGEFDKAQALEKAERDATKEKLDVDQKQLENAAKRFAIVGTGFAQLAQNPNATPQDALQLVQAYQKEQILPPGWEQNVPQNAMALPSWAQQMAMRSEQGTKYLEEFKSKPKLVNDGKRQFYVEENPRLATFGKEIGMSFENQPTPGELLTDKRQAPLAQAQTRLADAQASYNYGGAFGGGIQPQPAAPVPSAPIGALPQAAPGGALPLIPGIQPTQPLAPTLGRIPPQAQANAANDRRAILMAELAKQQEAGRVDPALVREIASLGAAPAATAQGQNVNVPQAAASGIGIPPELQNMPQAKRDQYILEQIKGGKFSAPQEVTGPDGKPMLVVQNKSTGLMHNANTLQPVGNIGPKMGESGQKQLIGVQNTKAAIDEYRKALADFGMTDIANPNARARMGTIYNNMLLQAKEAYNLGVLNGPDYMILQQVITSPMSWRGGVTTKQALDDQAKKLAQIMDKIGGQITATQSGVTAKPNEIGGGQTAAPGWRVIK